MDHSVYTHGSVYICVVYLCNTRYLGARVRDRTLTRRIPAAVKGYKYYIVLHGQPTLSMMILQSFVLKKTRSIGFLVCVWWSKIIIIISFSSNWSFIVKINIETGLVIIILLLLLHCHYFYYYCYFYYYYYYWHRRQTIVINSGGGVCRVPYSS